MRRAFETTTITETDAFDAELVLPDGSTQFVCAEIRYTVIAGDDFDAGDHWTPPYGGPWFNILNRELIAVEFYNDKGDLIIRCEAPDLIGSPLSASEIIEQLIPQENEDTYPWCK